MTARPAAQPFPIERLILAPDDPADWPAWRDFLGRWREDTRAALTYTDRHYLRPEFAWVPGCIVCAMVMVWDLEFYHPARGGYQVEALLEKGRADFGGYNAVVLWHAYPNLGFDDRNQFDFYRDLPGGLAALRGLCQAFHDHGVRLFVAYNPWDTGTRREDRADLDALAELTQAIEADGIFLDTLRHGTADFRAILDARRPGVVLESEGALPLECLHDHHMSWAQEFKDSPAPGVLRNGWVERRHMQHQIRRWNTDHTAELHTAWMNGAGMLVWENVFGTWVGWSARDRTLLRSMLPVQRRCEGWFIEGQWTPLVENMAAGVYASAWERPAGVLWTLVNRTEAAVEGPLLTVPPRAGYRYFDLIAGCEVAASSAGASRVLSGRLGPLAVGALLALAPESVDDDFLGFLAAQALQAARAEWDPASPQRQAQRLAAPHTLGLRPGEVPTGMAIVGQLPERLEIAHRVRECGLYEPPTYSNLSLTLLDLHQVVTAERSVRLAPFAIDRAEVTNRQFQDFLARSRYVPRNSANYLRHWRSGAPAAGEEDQAVVYVDLEDARAYARWAGRRLPTEDEWQVALAGGLAGHCTPRVWNWTESEHTDGRTRFCLLKGGAEWRAEGSVWYADGGPKPPEFSAKYLLMAPSLDRSGQIGFRCAADLLP